MSELLEVLTKDGSYSLRSTFFQENFHSLVGALEETKSKFTATSNLQRFKGKSLNVLDICFGLGYNSASFWMIAASIVPNSEVLIQNVGLNPTRTGILNVMIQWGVSMRF